MGKDFLGQVRTIQGKYNSAQPRLGARTGLFAWANEQQRINRGLQYFLSYAS
jgi:hypothetical protein